MNNQTLSKVYVRYRGDIPDGVNTAAALEGFRNRGVETVAFNGFGDIEALGDLGPSVGLVGFIGDIYSALRLLKKPLPLALDYPDSLTEYFHRKIRRGILDEVYRSTERVFVKPIQQKLFTGFVWEGFKSAVSRTPGLPGNTEVLISECVEFLSEYRTFVLDGRILDCRRYKGDWSKAPDRKLLENAVEIYCADPSSPRAFCLDVGVTNNSPCCLVEVNNSYSFGHYGLQSELYAQMLEANWIEMIG